MAPNYSSQMQGQLIKNHNSAFLQIMFINILLIILLFRCFLIIIQPKVIIKRKRIFQLQTPYTNRNKTASISQPLLCLTPSTHCSHPICNLDFLSFYSLQHQPLDNDRQSQRSNLSQKDQSYSYIPILTNPHEQMLLEQQQHLMDQGEDLKSQNKKLVFENNSLKKLVEQLSLELQSYRIQKSQELEMKAKIDYQEEMIVKLKSEVRRKADLIQENQFKVNELDRLQNKLEEYSGLTKKYQEQVILIQQLKEQAQDLNRELIQYQSTENENHNLKEYIEAYKQQIRDKDVKIQQQREQQEQLFSDNKKMKSTLDVLNFEFKKAQDGYNESLHRATIQNTELQGQLSLLQKNLTNQTHQIELQKQQVKQLELKEKELYTTKNQYLKLDEKFQAQTQQTIKQTKEIDKLHMTLKNGKQEYLNLQQKLMHLEQENKRLSEQSLQLSKSKNQLELQCQQLDQELIKKQGTLDTLQLKQMELKSNFEKCQGQMQGLENELKKKDTIILNLEQQLQAQKGQLEQITHIDTQNKSEINHNFAKMKEMHNDLILYEKQVKQINSENYQLKQQNQIIIERNAQQENEMKKMREQIMHQDNRIRYLENEIHNQSFQQKLTTARPIQSQEKGFQNQYPSSQQNTLQGSFNNQFNQYK
ncbi:unnamed protein product [Paramecium octaurelia]|uniref:Uncharacterized protein n=1 Tax=Paramecium octaurelia TaxID=43137 RepID=A0A8S1W9N1_PAROT|nr:unnamed protein product [Paramecium octaurelia]